MTHRISSGQIKAMLVARLPDLIAALGIRVHREYREYYHCFAPLRAEKKPSFYLRKTGNWKDLGGIDAPFRHGGDIGDIICLIAYCKCGRDINQAFREARVFLHIERGDLTHWRRQAAQAEAKQKLKKADDAAQRIKDQGRAFSLWLKGVSPLGTQTETYLRERRGVDLRKMPRLPGILRHLNDHRHECGLALPCMIAGCINSDGEIKAVHRTWLRADGSDKTEHDPPRKVWPDYAGLYIPIWRGQSAMSLAELKRQGEQHGLRETLGLIEGVDKALAWAFACPELRIWAFISLSNLGNLIIPECIDVALIWRDNDTKPQAIKQFEHARAALATRNAHTAFADFNSPTGKDADELLRGYHGEESEEEGGRDRAVKSQEREAAHS